MELTTLAKQHGLFPLLPLLKKCFFGCPEVELTQIQTKPQIPLLYFQ